MGLYTVSIIPNTRVFDSLGNKFLDGVSLQNIADIHALYNLFPYGICDSKEQRKSVCLYVFGVFIRTLTKSLGTANPDSPLDAVVPGFTMR